MSNLILESRDTSFSRRLRRRRIQVACAIAVVEAILVLAGVIPWWVVVVAAALAVASYVSFGRAHGSPLVRAATWVAAVSQLVVVLVPIALVVAGLLAIAVLVLVAVGALTVLLLDRR